MAGCAGASQRPAKSSTSPRPISRTCCSSNPWSKPGCFPFESSWTHAFSVGAHQRRARPPMKHGPTFLLENAKERKRERNQNGKVGFALSPFRVFEQKPASSLTKPSGCARLPLSQFLAGEPSGLTATFRRVPVIARRTSPAEGDANDDAISDNTTRVPARERRRSRYSGAGQRRRVGRAAQGVAGAAGRDRAVPGLPPRGSPGANGGDV